MSKMYNELARWWHLLSPPEDYIEEAEFFLPFLEEVTHKQPATLLELGSGGGNNVLYMKKAFAAVTLVDLSEQMLDMSRQINPECEHVQGDMRTVRLNRTFNAVFVHDAIDYMITRDDLKAAMQTAFVHCQAGGLALFVPDNVRETFEESSDHGGSDGDDHAIRYLEWSYDPDESDTSVVTHYVIMVREGGQVTHVEHDEHIVGLFALDDWLEVLSEVGFTAEYVVDSYDRYVFIAHKP